MTNHIHTVMERVLDCCQKFPDSIALQDCSRSITYSELHSVCKALAEQLLVAGVVPGDIIAINGDKSVGIIVSLLATFKIGCIAVPLAAELPAMRKTLMMQQASVSWLLYLENDHDAQNLQAAGIKLLCVDSQGSLITAPPNVNLSIELPGQDPCTAAYIFFTSGTTGKPKGVVGSHKALAHFINWQTHELGVGPGDSIAQLASISFDAMLKDVFLALTTGATLKLPINRPYENPHSVMEWIDREKISVIQTVPSVISTWIGINSSIKAKFSSVKLLCLAGEPLSASLVHRWRAEFPDCKAEIINLYGLTETTILKSFYRIPANPISGILPIGYPIADTELSLMKSNGQDCVPGEEGEIVIKSAFMTLGTIDECLKNYSPAQRTTRFRNCNSEVISYRTGDLGMFNSDGTLNIHGRIDDQLKIAGVRINPAEVSAHLAEHPDIKNCLVVPYEDNGQTCLTAYVVTKEHKVLEEENLRTFLETRLPRIMTPSYFVWLEKFPVSANGKVNKTLLPKPVNQDDSGSAKQRSMSHLELIVADIWSEVLRKKITETKTNFFAVGGHSLLAVQVIARIKKAFQCELSVPEFFRSPTIASLVEQIEKGTQAGMKRPPLVSLSRDKFPLASSQQGLWLLAQMEPESASYIMSGAIELPQGATLDIVEKCLFDLVNRHSVLRTTFQEEAEAVHQIVHPSICLSVNYLCLSKDSPEELERQFQQICSEAASAPFDLKVGPLLRATFISLPDEKVFLLLAIHHIICDAWSWRLITQELVSLIEMRINNKLISLPKVEFQFTDFAVWQSQWLKGEILAKQLEYWKEKLKEPREVTELPKDSFIELNDQISPQSQVHRFSLTTQLSERISLLARTHNATSFMALLAAFKVLMVKQTGNSDVIIGSDTSSRSNLELEKVIGMFVGTVALRSDLSGDPSFIEILNRIKEVTVGAYANQDVPFDRVVEALNPNRRSIENPLFQIMFRSPPNPFSSREFSIPTINPNLIVSKFDLTIVVWEATNGIEGRIEYNANLFSAERIGWLSKQYELVLSIVTENPDTRLSEISLANNLDTYPGANPTIISEQTIPPTVIDMFEQWVVKTPNQIAIIQGHESWTYLELFEEVNRIANLILARGVLNEQRVVVHGKRSYLTIASFLAVLKTGAVGFLLDSDLTIQQKSRLLMECKPNLVLSMDKTSDDLPYPNVKLETELHLGSRSYQNHPEFNRKTQIAPDSPAYIFFTSGSTGKPKGILGNHKGLAHFVLWEKNEFCIDSNQRIGQTIHLSFDAILREIFLPLISGATLCLPAPSDLESAEDLVKWLNRDKVTVIHTVPSILSSWLSDNSLAASFSHLRLLCLSGEPLLGTLVKRFRENFPSCPAEIVNFYGVTECTMIQAFLRVTNEHQFFTVIPVGQAIADTQIITINEKGMVCGVGELGEIIIRTKFGTHGYINGTTNDTSRFYKNPWTEDRHDILYRTGDLARLNPDGTFSLIGRTDDQIKINGVRIDPNEIISILQSFPGVRAAFVLPKQEDRGTSLISFVEPISNIELNPQEIMNYLIARLHSPTVPNLVSILESLPRLPNGKIDRIALMELKKPDAQVVIAHPKTDTQKRLAAIWQNALGVTQISIQDSFFQSGGHSLLATSVISKIRKEFGIELPLRSIFDNQTIESLANTIDQIVQQMAINSSCLIRVSSIELPKKLFCVHPISGGIGCYGDLAAALLPDICMYGFQAMGIDKGTFAMNDIPSIARMYIDDLIKTNLPPSIDLAGWSFGGLIAYEMGRQLKAEGVKVGTVILFDTYALQSAYTINNQKEVLLALLGDIATIAEEEFLQQFNDISSVDECFDKIASSGIMGSGEDVCEILKRRFDVVVAHQEAATRHKIRNAHLPVTLMRASGEERNDRTSALGWENMAIPTLDIQDVPGSHRSILKPPYVQTLANKIRYRLMNEQGV